MAIILASSACADFYPLPTAEPTGVLNRSQSPFTIDSIFASTNDQISLHRSIPSSNELWLSFVCRVGTSFSIAQQLFAFSAPGNAYATLGLNLLNGRLTLQSFASSNGAATDIGDPSPLLTRNPETRLDYRFIQDGINPISFELYIDKVLFTSGVLASTAPVNRLSSVRFGRASNQAYTPRISQLILADEDTLDMLLIQLQPDEVSLTGFTGTASDITVTGIAAAIDSTSLQTITSPSAAVTTFQSLPAGFVEADYDVKMVGCSYRSKEGKNTQTISPLVVLGEESAPVGVPSSDRGFTPKRVYLNKNPVTGQDWTMADAKAVKFGLTVAG